METARPFAPETRSRDRLWFGFRPDSRSDRRGTPAFRPDRPSADQGRGPPDRLVGTEAAARVSCGEPITPFRTANSPTETFRIWPHRIRLRLPPPVRFPAREVRSAGVFRSLRQEDGARETGWLGELDSNRRDAVDLAREARSAGVFRNLRKKT